MSDEEPRFLAIFEEALRLEYGVKLPTSRVDELSRVLAVERKKDPRFAQLTITRDPIEVDWVWLVKKDFYEG